MKFTAVIFSLITVCFIGQAHARTDAEVQKDLIRAATTAVAVYKKDGMSGLIGKTQSCYANTNEKGFYCFYFDLASRRIDQLMIADAAQKGMKWPTTEFYNDELFLERVAAIFIKANMDMKKSNDYLRSLTPVINKLVEDNLSNSGQQPISKEKEIAPIQTGNEAPQPNPALAIAPHQKPAQNESGQNSQPTDQKKEPSNILRNVILIYALIAGLISLKIVRPPFIKWYKSSSFFIFGKNPVDILLKQFGYRIGFELFVFALSCVAGGLGLWLVALKKKSTS